MFGITAYHSYLTDLVVSIHSIVGRLKMRKWKMRHGHNAGGGGGKYRSGKCRNRSQR